MKTREELEKMFDETFWDLWKVDLYNEEWKPIWYKNNTDEVKQFIFETIIPEVLKSIIKDLLKDSMYWEEENNPYWYCDDLDKYIKQKAKELYWIDL